MSLQPDKQQTSNMEAFAAVLIVCPQVCTGFPLEVLQKRVNRTWKTV